MKNLAVYLLSFGFCPNRFIGENPVAVLGVDKEFQDDQKKKKDRRLATSVSLLQYKGF